MAAVRILRLFVAVAAVVVITPGNATACTCVPDIPLCESFWQSDAVFAGEVTQIEERRPAKAVASFLGTRRVRISVEQVWRGDVPPSVEVTTGSGGGDCGYPFRKGRKYLVYASEEQGRLITHVCAPTKPFDRAAADLEYLNAAAASTGGRVYGIVRRADRRSARKYMVVLDGGGQRQTVTDANGAFEFTDVPAGSYTVRVLPRDTEGAYGRQDVRLTDPRACARRDFTIEPER